MEFVFDWLSKNWVESIAAVLGLIGIFLQIRQNHWYWLSAIIMVIMYIFVFYKSKFYADMSFQFYYLFVSGYGWYLWLSKKNPVAKQQIRTSKLSKKQWFYCILASIKSIYRF
jgi:nicotinamide mononucleotide transporter